MVPVTLGGGPAAHINFTCSPGWLTQDSEAEGFYSGVRELLAEEGTLAAQSDGEMVPSKCQTF